MTSQGKNRGTKFETRCAAEKHKLNQNERKTERWLYLTSCINQMMRAWELLQIHAGASWYIGFFLALCAAWWFHEIAMVSLCWLCSGVTLKLENCWRAVFFQFVSRFSKALFRKMRSFFDCASYRNTDEWRAKEQQLLEALKSLFASTQANEKSTGDLYSRSVRVFPHEVIQGNISALLGLLQEARNARKSLRVDRCYDADGRGLSALVSCFGSVKANEMIVSVAYCAWYRSCRPVSSFSLGATSNAL